MTDKYFISYKFTGRDINELHAEIDPIVEAMQIASGCNDVFCNLYYDDIYNADNYTVKEILDHCFGVLKNCDVYIAYVTDEFGGGMAIECGYAYCLGKTIVACIPESKINASYKSLYGLCNSVIYYSDIADLCTKLGSYATAHKKTKH